MYVGEIYSGYSFLPISQFWQNYRYIETTMEIERAKKLWYLASIYFHSNCDTILAYPENHSPSISEIPCQPSKYLTVPKPLIRLTYLDHSLRIIISLWSFLQHYIWYNFVSIRAGLELMMPCLNQLRHTVRFHLRLPFQILNISRFKVSCMNY